MQGGSKNIRDSSSAPELSNQDIIDVLIRRKLAILIMVGFGLLVGFLFATRSRRFLATGEIRIQPGTSNMYRTSVSSMIDGSSADKIDSEATILQSRTLYLRVAKELDLANNPAFWGDSHVKHQSLDSPLVREDVFRRMRKAVSVQRQPKQEILTISCTTISPELSAKVVNSLINDYVAYLFQMRYGATQRASGWLIGQLDDLKNQIEQDQTSITQLQGKLGVLGGDDKGSTNYLFDESLRSLAKASSDATIERIVAEAKLRYLQESDPSLIEGEVNLLGSTTPPPNGLLQNLRDSQARISSDYSKLLAQTGPNYPEVKQLRAQLAEVTKQVKAEEARILNQAKISYDAASANETMTDTELQKQKSQAFNSRDEMVRYSILLHDYEAHRNLYEGLVARLREAGITSGMEAGEIDIVDLADLPAIPAPPGPVTFVLAGILGGFVLGGMLASLLESLDTQVKTREQADAATGINLLAQLPHFKAAVRSDSHTLSHLLVDAAPKSRYAESMQTARSNILMSRPGDPPRVFVVTSAIPGEGKSTTSLNLASVFARHRSRVLLVDCDMRCGALALRLNLSASKGLSNVLTNQVSLEDAIQAVPGNSFMFFLAGGTRPPDPAVLTSSEEFRILMDTCRKQFDFVLLDLPPMLGLSDVLNVGGHADAAILVVRQGYSNRKAVQEASQQITNASLPLIGYLLNDVSAASKEYGYGYGSYYEETPSEKV